MAFSSSHIFLKKFSPIQILVLGFLIMTIAGAILLMLPISSANHKFQPFIDALFTSTSAVSTTGLVVVDTGSYYSFFGQIVMITLVQIGGLGYMVFIVLLLLKSKNQFTVGGRKLLRQSLSRPLKMDMIKFTKVVFVFTFVIEALGALGIFIYFRNYFSVSEAIYQSIFHSISAFCTAGFSLFPDSFMKYGHSTYLNIIIDVTCILGALGFFVLYDIYEKFLKAIKKIYPSSFSLHTKIVLSTTVLLTIIGCVFIYFSDGSKFSGNILFRILDDSFQVLSAFTTTGFNSVDVGAITHAGLFILIILMFIGASPGSTGGGIKTSTFAVLFKYVVAVLRGEKDVNLFKRKVEDETVSNSIAITIISLFWILIALSILTLTDNFNFIRILFELTSAFGTVGLSTGITSSLSIPGKLIITITMFLGRVGPLALGLSMISPAKINGFKYPEEDVLVG